MEKEYGYSRGFGECSELMSKVSHNISLMQVSRQRFSMTDDKNTAWQAKEATFRVASPL
jgi:hypothetical protein